MVLHPPQEDGTDRDGSGGISDDSASYSRSEIDDEEEPHDDDAHLDDCAQRMLRKIRENFFTSADFETSDSVSFKSYLPNRWNSIGSSIEHGPNRWNPFI